jgi:hypothetical protein
MGDGDFLFLGSEGLYQTLERLARERGLIVQHPFSKRCSTTIANDALRSRARCCNDALRLRCTSESNVRHEVR